MWSQQKPNGKYQYFEEYKDPLTNKFKTVSVTLPLNRKKDKDAARRILAERIRARSAQPVRSSALTLKNLSKLYVESQKKSRKASTAKTTEYKMKVICELLGEDSVVKNLSAPYVRRQLSACRSDEDVTNVTFNERLKYFKAMIRWAYEEELVQDISYLEKLKKKTESKKAEKAKYLEGDELQILIESMAVPEWKLVTRFLALSGLRIGELIALNDIDIDLFSREIHVRSTYSLVTFAIDTTKTDTSTRDVYMQDELFECVKDIISYKKKNIELFGHPSPYFFPTIDGDRLHYDAYRKYLKENAEKVVGRSLTPHALRHTHVALLAEHGISLDAISRRLGHADSQITREIYFHVTERMKEKENAAIKNVKFLSFSYPAQTKNA